jgi:hypothetical protein
MAQVKHGGMDPRDRCRNNSQFTIGMLVSVTYCTANGGKTYSL